MQTTTVETIYHSVNTQFRHRYVLGSLLILAKAVRILKEFSGDSEPSCALENTYRIDKLGVHTTKGFEGLGRRRFVYDAA